MMESATRAAPVRCRTAATLVEVVIVAGLVVLVIGAVLLAFGVGRRQERSAQLTSAMLAALLAKEQIALDLRHMGVRPGPEGPVRIGPASLAFYRASFDGPKTRLRPVRYTFEKTARGHLRLVREEFGPHGRRSVMRDAVFASIRFQELVDPKGQGRYVLVSLEALSDDATGAPAGPGTFPLKFLTECAIPSMLGANVLSDGANLVVEGDLPQPL